MCSTAHKSRALRAAILLLAALPASAQEVGEHSTAFFVPELLGAATFDVTFEGRFDEVLEDGHLGLPSNALKFHAGYLHYLEPHGRLAVGGYLGGGFSLVDDPERPQVVRLDAGATVRLRGISADFFHASLAAFVEGGPLLLDRAPPGAETEETRALRWATGVEIGPGLLWFLDPYIFGESLARLGVESVHFGGQQVWSVFAGMRLQFDFALRRGLPW